MLIPRHSGRYCDGRAHGQGAGVDTGQPPTPFALNATPVHRHRRHGPLLGRAWELRQNLTIYDGVYVALAERLGTTLVTADNRLGQAPGTRCRIEVLGL